MTNNMSAESRTVLEASARALGREKREIDTKFSILTADMGSGFNNVRDQMDRFERKLSGIGSTVGSLASAYRASRAAPARRTDPALTITRACLARLWAHDLGRNADEVAEQVYGAAGAEVVKALNDPAGFIEKAATSPAMTTVAGWAAELVNTVSNFGVIRTLAPQSAYSQLSGHGARLNIGPNASIRLINRSATATGGFFRAEGSPLPVRAMNFGSGTARVYSGGMATVVSGELLRRSSPNAEQVLRTALSEDAALEIDSILLGSAAGTATQPAGLLYGATVVPPASVVARDAEGAALADVSALITAVPGVSDPVYIARREVVARLLGLVPGFGATSASLIVSPLVPADTLALIDGDDLWSAEGDGFEIDSTYEATLVSSNPGLPEVDAAGTVGAPTLNMFQMDLAAIRILVDLGWGLRAGRAATVTGVAW
jgi:HK97 family phage major capsid protein